MKFEWPLAVCVILFLLGLGAVGLGIADAVPIRIGPSFKLPSAIVLIFGALAGALLTWRIMIMVLVTSERPTRAESYFYSALPAIILLAGLLLFAGDKALDGPRAAIVLVLLTLALFAGARCIELLAGHEPIGFETHWGGLGGGAGGWRLFPTTALAILALSFAGGALALVVTYTAGRQATSNKQVANISSTTNESDNAIDNAAKVGGNTENGASATNSGTTNVGGAR